MTPLRRNPVHRVLSGSAASWLLRAAKGPLLVPARYLAVCVASLAPGVLSAVASAQDTREIPSAAPLPAPEVASLKRIEHTRPLALSADGRWVAFTIHQSFPGRRPGTHDGDVGKNVGRGDEDVWIANTATGETHSLTGGRGTSWGPSWSPDGTRLAFYSDVDGALRVWVWERASHRLHRASGAAAQPGWLGEPRWTPDGRGLVVTIASRDGGASRKAAAPGVRGTLPHVYRSSSAPTAEPQDSAVPDVNGASTALGDLVVIDVSRGHQHRIVQGERIVGWWLAPSGRTVAFLRDRGTAPATSGRLYRNVVDVITVDVATGQRTIVGSHASVGAFALSFSPDSRFLAYAIVEYGAQAQRFRTCFVAPVQGTARPVSLAAGQQLDWSPQPPVWDVSSGALYFHSHGTLWRIRLGRDGASDLASPLPMIPGREEVTWIATTDDGAQAWSAGSPNALVVVTRDTVTQGNSLVQVEWQPGAAAPIHTTVLPIGDAQPAAIGSIVGSNVNGVLVFSSEAMNAPADLWTTQHRQTALGAPRQLTRLNPAVDRRQWSDTRVISWQDALGRQLRGLLMLPANYDARRRYPLIVYQYPGDLKSANVTKFGGDAAADLANMHLFTSRGYVVLLPDIPRPDGDTAQLDRTWRTIQGGVDGVVAMGVADSNRLGIMGHSFGGYATVGTIIATSRFRAAVALSGGGYNFPSQFLQLQPDGRTVYSKAMSQVLEKSLWEAPSLYVTNSPIFFLDRVHTPLLLITGADDDSGIHQSDQVFVGLQYLGREVEYALYQEAGHSYDEWTWRDQVDVMNRIIGWFDGHLKDTAHDPHR